MKLEAGVNFRDIRTTNLKPPFVWASKSVTQEHRCIITLLLLLRVDGLICRNLAAARILNQYFIAHSSIPMRNNFRDRPVLYRALC
jgi:hypothetical protein